MKLYRDMIKKALESSPENARYFLFDALIVIESLKDFKNLKNIFELVRLIFRGKLSVSKKLKLEKLIEIDIPYVIYKGTFKNYSKVKVEEVQVEFEIEEHQVKCSIIFIDTGEIRQRTWRPDQ